jgi:hypothetical protein
MPVPTLPQVQRKSRYKSELFTIRMWREYLNDHFEWRGKVVHGSSRKECYFRDWETLTTFITQKLSDENRKSGILPH